MGRTPTRAKLVLVTEARSKLESIAKSRTEGQARIERAKVLLTSKAELKARIMHYLQDLNADPVVFRWRYKIEEASVS